MHRCLRVRLDLSIDNRQTGDRTKFAVTYAPSAGPLPVQILYQPSFWLRIESIATTVRTFPPTRRRTARNRTDSGNLPAIVGSVADQLTQAASQRPYSLG